MDKINFADLKFAINEVKTLSCLTLNNDEVKKEVAENKGKLNYSLNIPSFIDLKQNIIGYDVTVGFFLEREDNIIFQLAVRLTYFVENLVKYCIKSKSGELRVHPELDQILLHISISTFRGVMAVKVEGTAIYNVILPLIDVATLNRM